MEECCGDSDYQGAPLDLNRVDSNYMNHKGVLYTSGLQHQILSDIKIIIHVPVKLINPRLLNI